MAEMNDLKQIYTEANFKEKIANWTPQTVRTGEYMERIISQVERLRNDIVATE